MDNLSQANQARLEQALAKLYNYHGRTMSLRAIIEQTQPMVTHESDGMIDYSRTKFNRLGSTKEQEAYIAMLKARRLYWVNDILVPKMVYDWARKAGTTQPPVLAEVNNG